MKRPGLGRGLDVLLPQTEELLQTVVRDISIDEIDPNGAQPRKEFDKEALEQLSQSIRESGVLSPILVVEEGGRYRIVAGERRYRASRLAGLSTIPCIVRNMTTVEQMEAALVENLQREDLNPIEEAAAIRSLMNECNYTQEEAAKRLGKSRPAIANSLRLLNLPQSIIEMITRGELSAGHARVLAGLDDEALQLKMAEECIHQGYSVRKLEEAARQTSDKPAAPKRTPAAKTLSPELNAFQEAMREVMGVKTVLTGNGEKGKITLTYNSADELEGIFQTISKLLM